MEEFRDVSAISKNAKKAINHKGKQVVIHPIHYIGLPKNEKRRIIEMYNTISRIDSTYLIHFKGAIVDSDAGSLNIITEYQEGSTLQAIIDKAKQDCKPLAVDFIWKTITQIALALYDLHNHEPNSIAHGGISADHIIITPSGAKVGGIDLLDETANPEKDILDLANVIFEMVTLTKYQGHHRLDYPLLNKVDEGFRELLLRLIEMPNGHRYNIVQVLEFPEVSIEVMKEKIATEKLEYEKEVQRISALENDLITREKQLKAAGVDVSSLPNLKI